MRNLAEEFLVAFDAFAVVSVFCFHESGLCCGLGGVTFVCLSAALRFCYFQRSCGWSLGGDYAALELLLHGSLLLDATGMEWTGWDVIFVLGAGHDLLSALYLLRNG